MPHPCRHHLTATPPGLGHPGGLPPGEGPAVVRELRLTTADAARGALTCR
jgi:hypothetical protein